MSVHLCIYSWQFISTCIISPCLYQLHAPSLKCSQRCERTNATCFGDIRAELCSRCSPLFSSLLLTFSFSTARRKWGDESGIKSGTFSSWLILRLPLCPSQCHRPIEADRGVKLSPGPGGGAVLWAQESNQPSSSTQRPWIQTAFDFLALRCKLHIWPLQMCVYVFAVCACVCMRQPEGNEDLIPVGGCCSLYFGLLGSGVLIFKSSYCLHAHGRKVKFRKKHDILPTSVLLRMGVKSWLANSWDARQYFFPPILATFHLFSPTSSSLVSEFRIRKKTTFSLLYYPEAEC